MAKNSRNPRPSRGKNAGKTPGRRWTPTLDRIDALLHACGRPGPILVLMQDNPDPDALASAAALRALIRHKLHKSVTIAYGGIYGRAENRVMASILRIGARQITPAQLAAYNTVCLVDCQPCAGNNLLQNRRAADVVIDHHLTPKRKPWTAPCADVRPDYGAASTILYEYLRAADVPITSNLATALFCGIQSDTQDLGREARPADIRAYQELFLIADQRKLARIRLAPVSAEYFRALADSLSHCVVAGTAVISYVPACHSGDTIAEIADRLMRLEGMRATVCYGIADDTIYLSARASTPRVNVAHLIRRVVKGIGTGGGHRMMAAGQIPVNSDIKERLALVRSRILRVFAPNKNPIPLLSFPDKPQSK